MKPAPLQSSAERVQALISEILTYAEDGLFRDVDKEELMELVWYVQDLEKLLKSTEKEVGDLVRTHVDSNHKPGPYTSKYGCGCFYCEP